VALISAIDYGEEETPSKNPKSPPKNISFTQLQLSQHPQHEQFLGDLKMFSSKTFTDFSQSKEGSGTKSISINASYEVFLEEDRLAVPVNEYGKAAIMNMSCTVGSVSFNKYSGVAEFANCMYLWVNITSDSNESNRYENTFGCNGRTMQWFGGSKMKADSAQTQRLLSSGAVVLLFVRLAGQPYLSLGRLLPLSCDVSSLPIAVTWQLQDFEAVRNKTVFQEILAIQQQQRDKR